MNFLSNIISGISLGSVYAIIALGYTMVYGIAKMLNFAHGDVIMVGGYVCFFAMFSFGLHPVIAVLLAIIACTLLGITIERIAYKPLRSAPALAVLITAIGVSYFLQNAAQLLWTSSPKVFKSVVPKGYINLFDGQLSIAYDAESVDDEDGYVDNVWYVAGETADDAAILIIGDCINETGIVVPAE